MKRVLPVIVISQFLCTSLWFAGNAVMDDIIKNAGAQTIANLTSSVQFGFIIGTFLFALLTISDRYSPVKVFLISSLIAALFNCGMTIGSANLNVVYFFRFMTGFFLAGIYPVGMKIASDHYEKGLGRSLGYLVGALVLGTSVSHLIKTISFDEHWKYVIYCTSLLSVCGGLLMIAFVPDGPFRKPIQRMQFNAFLSGFKNRNFRSAAFGYFGHMWELYAFWAFIPSMLPLLGTHRDQSHSLFSFLIIASGAIACMIVGNLSRNINPSKIAFTSLLLSLLCCLVSPFMFHNLFIWICFLFFWGMVVVADSPMFSSLIAKHAPEESRGASLTIINCIGFSITIISIQLLSYLSGKVDEDFKYMLLAIGPLIGLIAMRKK